MISSLADLTFDTQNPNAGTDEGRAMVRDSLARLGAGRSILADRNGKIIAGNKTAQQALAEGLDILTVHTTGDKLVAVVRDDLDLDTDQVARELSIADNRTSEVGLAWDMKVLADLDVDLTQYFDDDFLADLPLDLPDIVEPEQVPSPRLEKLDEIKTKWKVEEGQIWTIPSIRFPGKSHRILCGDSTDPAMVRRLMQGERATLFATDPPYLVDYDGTNHPGQGDKVNKDWEGEYSDWDQAKDGDGLYDGFVSVALQEAIAENAAWYCWHASTRQPMVQEVWERHGAFVHQQIIWVKSNPVLTYSWYMWQHEPCLFGWVRGNKPSKVTSDYPRTVWQVESALLPGQETLHPTQKPIQLFTIPMEQHTRAGELCYEPFSGSGTQLVAAESIGRICYAMELNPAFVAVALERLSEMGLEPLLVPTLEPVLQAIPEPSIPEPSIPEPSIPDSSPLTP